MKEIETRRWLTLQATPRRHPTKNTWQPQWKNSHSTCVSHGRRLLFPARMKLLLVAAAVLAVASCARMSLEDMEFHAWKLKFCESVRDGE